MGSIIRHKDPRSGITYFYSNESYWDKEKKQPRSKRVLIGKLDEETGEMVPTGGRGRKRKDPDAAGTTGKAREAKAAGGDGQELARLKKENEMLKAENARLKRERAEAAEALGRLAKKLSD